MLCVAEDVSPVPGWILLISEDAEQARVIVALIVSVAFLSLHLTIKPLRRYVLKAM